MNRAQMQTAAGLTGDRHASSDNACTEVASSDSFKLVKSVREISRRARIAGESFAGFRLLMRRS
jgi:hypothetical protein